MGRTARLLKWMSGRGLILKRTKFAIKCRRQRKSTRTRCAKSSLVSERREYMDIDYFMHHEVRNGVPRSTVESAIYEPRSFEQPRRIDPIVAQRRQQGGGLPMAVRDLGDQAATARGPASQRRHVGLGPALVDEHQAGSMDTAPDT